LPARPADFGIRNGITQPIGLPQINVTGGALNFGGPANNPSGRGDTTFVAADTVNWLYGRHSLKLGGEYRQFLNNNSVKPQALSASQQSLTSWRARQTLSV